MSSTSIPLPTELRHLTEPDAPLMIGTYEVALLLEHWGFSRDGRGAVKKLVKCDLLKKTKLTSFAGWRFNTAEVLEFYHKEKAQH